MAENDNASTLIAAAGLAGLAFLGYQYIYLPELEKRRQQELLRRELERQARSSGRSGSWLDIVGVAGCTAAAQSLGVPIPVAAPVCGIVGPKLPKMVYDINKAAFVGGVQGVKTASVAVARAGGEVVTAISKPVVTAGKTIGKGAKAVAGFFDKIF